MRSDEELRKFWSADSSLNQGRFKAVILTTAATDAQRSIAWHYGPLRSKIGILELADNRLAFAEGENGEHVIFDAPLDEVEVEGWPSYGVAPNSQVKLRVAGKKLQEDQWAGDNAKLIEQMRTKASPVGATSVPTSSRICS
jgi:hypothetical protein